MVQAPSFSLRNFLERRGWVSYRGTRAGRQVKERETHKRHLINYIHRPRPIKHAFSGSCADPQCIKLQDYSPYESTEIWFKSCLFLHFYYQMLCRFRQRLMKFERPFAMQIWTLSILQNRGSNPTYQTTSYQFRVLTSSDWTERLANMEEYACMSEIIFGSIFFQILWTIILWVQMWLPRLSRGTQSIVVGTVYYPPSSNDPLILAYFQEAMSNVEARFPDCGVILLGDFNKLDMTRIKNAYGVKQVVPRGNSKLDLVFTNLSAFYDVPIERPLFKLFDHDTVEIQPLARQKFPENKILLKSRDLRATKLIAIRTYLEEVNIIELLVGSKVSCEEKCQVLETTIKTGMDILMPLKSKKIVSSEPASVSFR